MYPALVANPRGDEQPPIEVKFLVEAGAMFTCLPAAQLEALGLAPQWQVPIVLADGRHETWMAPEIRLTLDGRTLHTTCLFGPVNSPPLLGAVTIEQFALSVNPLTRADPWLESRTRPDGLTSPPSRSAHGAGRPGRGGGVRGALPRL
jgi:predicted aspartyl protease